MAEERLYSFSELSPEAKERAIRKWRDTGRSFDEVDAQTLTDDLTLIAEERGFEEGVKVSWSLGYTQGDGVCFEGTVDPEKLIKQKGFRKYKSLFPYVSIGVKNSNRKYCHWNSMGVEVNLDIHDYRDVMEPALRDEIRDWEDKQVRKSVMWRRQVEDITKLRDAPIREWERQEAGYGKGVLDWWPGRPDPLDIPYPPEPVPEEMPGRYRRAVDTAKKKVERLEGMLGEFETDLFEWIKDLSIELEKIGYAEIDYRGSEEQIIDTFEANNYKFTEEGDIRF